MMLLCYWKSENSPLSKVSYCSRKNHWELIEKVLHCFMGSGSTGQAAINLKGNFIGFELDNKLRKLIVQSYFGREISVYLIQVF
ncbi:DNA modification methylase [Peribacillus frigoritolerans]|jgi:DNA modification methylase|nr:DNA modification methylase [Peribacillus frigoritolerans]PCD06643.1 hypothetical protein CMV16_16020 [Peribacillus simplex]